MPEKKVVLFVRTSHAFHAFTSSAHWRYQLDLNPSSPRNLNVLSNNTSPSQTSPKATHTHTHVTLGWLCKWSSLWLNSGDVWHFNILTSFRLLKASLIWAAKQLNWSFKGILWLDWARSLFLRKLFLVLRNHPIDRWELLTFYKELVAVEWTTGRCLHSCWESKSKSSTNNWFW